MRKSFYVSSIAAILLGGAFVSVEAQNNNQQGGLTCEQVLKKPFSEEELKKYTDEQRKQYNEFVKSCKDAKDIEAKNAKAQNTNAVINRTLKEGNDAYNSKNYDLAIAKYDEGYNADVEFVGSAPVMLNNKAAALRSRGVERFNAAAKTKDAAGREAAKKDFQDAVDASTKALEILNKNQAPADPAGAKNFQAVKMDAFANRAENYRLLVKADSTKAADALKAYQEYIAVETDAAKKSKAQFTAADMAMQAGEVDLAVAEYQKIVDSDPSNQKAVFQLGVALIAQSANMNNDKAKMQQGVNYLQKFIDVAPANDPQKAEAQAIIDANKAENNITPVKGGGKGGRKGKN